MNETIIKTIKQYEVKGDFTYARVTDEMITSAQQQLGMNLPEQYISFLRNYGHGGVGGVDTLGVGLDGSLVFVEETIEYREHGLPNRFIVIENIDEWLYCIDSDTQKIVSWDSSGYIKEEYSCFDDYLIDQMNNAIENL